MVRGTISSFMKSSNSAIAKVEVLPSIRAHEDGVHRVGQCQAGRAHVQFDQQARHLGIEELLAVEWQSGDVAICGVAGPRHSPAPDHNRAGNIVQMPEPKRFEFGSKAGVQGIKHRPRNELFADCLLYTSPSPRD